MEIKILGAGKVVTGSCYSLSVGKEKILVDCGMFQGSKELEKLNYDDFSFNPKEYSALILTHAHLDHCGRIPHLIRDGFRGKIYATDATKALAEIVMKDSAKIAMEDTENENKKRAIEKLAPRNPIYTLADVEKTLDLFVIVDYDQKTSITPNISATFYDAGHILGSSSIRVDVNEGGKEKKVVFSGDLGQEDSILVKHTEAITDADYVFMESTYGDRLHGPLEERKTKLIKIINETHKIGGKVFIPSFAIERSQELLFYIGEFMEQGLIPHMPVFLDSPMAIRATEVFKNFTEHFNSDVQKRIEKVGDVFNFPELKMTEGRTDSVAINSVQGPCIILAGSGMCTGGRIKHHIVNNIEEERNTFLFVGFQVEGTLGYWIKKGEKKINLLGKEVKVRSRIESIDGFSAHADRDGLFKWLDNYSPKPKVFIIHGEEDQQVPLSENLKKKGFETKIPSLNEVINL